eukprot:6842595-Prymnesium_polylepis.1
MDTPSAVVPASPPPPPSPPPPTPPTPITMAAVAVRQRLNVQAVHAKANAKGRWGCGLSDNIG